MMGGELVGRCHNGCTFFAPFWNDCVILSKFAGFVSNKTAVSVAERVPVLVIVHPYLAAVVYYYDLRACDSVLF